MRQKAQQHPQHNSPKQAQQRIRMAIIYGGQSAEHAVSIESATQLIHSLDPERYDPILICINHDGRWVLQPTCMQLSKQQSFPQFSSVPAPAIALLPDFPGQLINLSTTRIESEIDVVFPLIHGTSGEDGSLQGFLKMANVAYVGCDVLSSAIAMDKDVSKQLLRGAGILVAKHISFSSATPAPHFDEVATILGNSFFVKPANMGSSIGVSRVDSAAAYRNAVLLAKQFDTKIILEEEIRGREIECAIIGNNTLWVSPLGEVKCALEFYNYEAKYWNPNSTQLSIPADISKSISERIQSLAQQTYRVLNCSGMARIDFFLCEDRIYVNEVNTLPGFTPQSMFPKLWENAGITLSDVADKLVELALERHRERNALKTSLDCF